MPALRHSRDEIGRGGLASERDIYLYRANEAPYLMARRGAPYFGHGTWALNLTPRRVAAATPKLAGCRGR